MASQKDVDTLGRTTAGEARNQTKLAQLGVAYVAVTRSKLAAAYVKAHAKPHPEYGDGSIAAACLVHEQFDCWNIGDPNRSYITALTLDDDVLQSGYVVALAAILALEPDPTGGATHYWDISIPPPAWAIGKPERSIGRLRFVTLT